MESGATARRGDRREVVGGFRRSASQRPRRAGRGLEPERARGRGAVPPGAGPGRRLALGLFPDRRRQRFGDAQPFALRRDRGNDRRKRDHQPLGERRCRLGSGLVGTPAAHGGIERSRRAGGSGRSCRGAPLGAVRAGVELPSAAGAGRGEAAPRRDRGSLRKNARADAQPLLGRRGPESGRRPGRDAIEEHPGAGDRYRRAARAARERDRGAGRQAAFGRLHFRDAPAT